MEDPPIYLTSYEVSRILRCSIKTVRRYRLRGQLRYVQLNSRRFLYETDSVMEFRKARTAD